MCSHQQQDCPAEGTVSEHPARISILTHKYIQAKQTEHAILLQSLLAEFLLPVPQK